MANYTVSLDARREGLVDWYLGIHPESPPKAEWLQGQVQQIVEMLALQKRDADQQMIMNAYNTLPSDQQDALFAVIQRLLQADGAEVMAAFHALEEGAQAAFVAEVRELLGLPPA